MSTFQKQNKTRRTGGLGTDRAEEAKIRLFNVPVADLGLRKCSETVASAATGLDVAEATYHCCRSLCQNPIAGTGHSNGIIF